MVSSTRSGFDSAIIVPLPEVAVALGSTSDAGSSGASSSELPPHVTVLYPFVRAEDIDDGVIEEVAEFFARTSPFQVRLGEIRRFPSVVYLAPEPAERFIELTETIRGRYPAFQPYGGSSTPSFLTSRSLRATTTSSIGRR